MAHIQYCMDFDFTHLKDRELGSFSSLPTIPSFCFVTFQIACSFISEKAASFSRSAELHSDPMSPSTSRCPCFLPTRSPQASSHRYQPIARDTSPSRDDQLRSPADDLPKRHSAADGVRVAETLRFQPDPGEALPVRRGAGSEGGQSVLVEQQAHGSKEGRTAVEPPLTKETTPKLFGKKNSSPRSRAAKEVAQLTEPREEKPKRSERRCCCCCCGEEGNEENNMKPVLAGVSDTVSNSVSNVAANSVSNSVTNSNTNSNQNTNTNSLTKVKSNGDLNPDLNPDLNSVASSTTHPNPTLPINVQTTCDEGRHRCRRRKKEQGCGSRRRA